jgi:WD40 repeat protein
MAGVSGERQLRPFPALDPEPPRGITWRRVRWPIAASVLAGAVVAVLLTWPSSSTSGSAPARFADGDGLVVFEQQPSGLLGTAAPDGRHPVMLTRVGPLQGFDLPVASSDGRFLVNTEGQLVTMGPAGPVTVSSLPAPAAVQAFGVSWADASFADGDKYVVATACYSVSSASESWVADLIPTAGGHERMLGTVTDSAGDPESVGALESAPVSAAAATSFLQCSAPVTPPDKAIELVRPGQAPRTIVTAAELTGALGWPPGTPVLLTVYPSPSGSRLALSVAAEHSARSGMVVITRAGRIVADRPLPADTIQVRWSPDGQQIAFGQASFGRASFGQASGNGPSSVTVWTVGTASRTIVLPGRHDLYCTQLLWSPDGSQLIYAAQVTSRGLTQADDLQHGWTVIDLRSGRVHDVIAPGQPAAWLPIAGEAG